MSKEDLRQEADKRKPRKKGQKRKSSKHSDLYTDEDPKGTIHGLGFKDAATARKGRAIINKARRKHAHKVQAALVMKQRAKVAKERTKDPEKKKNLNAAYKVWSEYLEKLKAKTKKMKKNEAHVLEEGAMDSVYELYNDFEIGMIKRYPDLGETIAKYGEALSYIPGPIGAAGGLAVFATKLAQGKEREAYSALFVGLTALVGGGAITKILSRAALGSTSMTAAIKIVNRIPEPIVRLGGGAQKMTVKLAKYLPWITQAGVNQVENEVNAAGEVIESVKGRDGFSKKPQKFRMRTIPDPELKTKKVAEDVSLDEKKRKHPRYRPPRKDPKTGKYDNPCGKGFAPGAQSGVKTKIGPQSGRRVSNCEPIKKKKNEAVLEAVLNRLLKEQDDLTTPGDLIWKGYLGWSVPKDQVGDVTSVPEAMISNRIQRDGGEDKFHITIISPVEVRAIANKIRDEQGLSGGKSKKEAKRQLFLAAAELEGPDYTIGQVSSVSGEGDGSVGVKGQPSEAHYKPVMWQAAQRLRAKFGLPPKDLHVTIGIGENGDVHGIEKQ